MLRSRRLLRHVAPLAAICLLAACTENGREPLLSRVQPIVIPPADTATRTNVNISNPTLDFAVQRTVVGQGTKPLAR